MIWDCRFHGSSGSTDKTVHWMIDKGLATDGGVSLCSMSRMFRYTPFRRHFGGFSPEIHSLFPEDKWRVVSDAVLGEPTTKALLRTEFGGGLLVLIGESGFGIIVERDGADRESLIRPILAGNKECERVFAEASLSGGMLTFACGGSVRCPMSLEFPGPVTESAHAVLIDYCARCADLKRREFLRERITSASSKRFTEQLAPYIGPLELSDDCLMLDDLGWRSRVERVRVTCARAWMYRDVSPTVAERMLPIAARAVSGA